METKATDSVLIICTAFRVLFSPLTYLQGRIKKVSLLPLCIFLCLLVFGSTSAFSDDSAGVWESKYKDEPYLRLLNEMTIKLNDDFTYTQTGHVIDKIQNEAGKSKGEVDFSYDQKHEEIQNIEAYTMRPDGTKIKCDSIQDQNDPNEYGIYTDERRKIVTAPEVLVGNTIDVKISSLHKVPVIDGNFFDSFRFSCTCPIKEARYRLIAPANMKLNIKMLNTDLKPRIEHDGKNIIYTWETFNNAKDEIEEYMPSGEAVFPEIVVSTLDSWDQLAKWFWSLNKKNLKSSSELKSKVADITAGKATIDDKIQAIIDYIRNEFRYVSMNIEAHGYEPHPTDEIFQHKYGDCKDQTLLAIAMLSEIGVQARPALVSTWAELKRDDLLPIPSYFNHAILSFDINGITHYTDVLKKGYNFTELPAYLTKRKVLSVKEGKFIVLPESDDIETTNVRTGNISIKEDGTAVVEYEYVFSRSASISMQDGLKNLPADDKEKFFAAIEAQLLSGGTLIGQSWKNLDMPHKQVIYTIRFETSTLVQRMGDFLMFGLNQVPRGSQFSAPKRKLPIVFTSDERSEENIKYSIPKGFEISSLPKRVALETAIRGLQRDYSVVDGQIIAHQAIFTKRATIPVANYPQIQKFLEDMPRLTNDKIVIRKKDDNDAPKISSLK